ncbi:MAG TPA: hypothetical protein VNZ22_07660, partial [Bacillota bacterium]|nr:hypothetical protein [Bacillota bacterium]
MNTSTMSLPTPRRQFICTSLAGALSLALSPALARAASSGGAIPIGFQLYTLRGEFAHNVPGTLKQVAQIGYSAVEFWGYGGTPNVYQQYSAKQLRALLDENGL